ncbi:MAG TPA: plastocyanin/azurin family copper-binding protein [Mycobacteriales bacterium]|jgi:plastocyanin|nr:plastocyanin/azurin family copper-binding protein [Mycobacteriales bacterium]
MLADRRTLHLAAVLAATVALVSCGNTDRIKPSAHATPVPVPSFQPTVHPAPTTNAPTADASSGAPSASASATGGGGGGDVVTATSDNKFSPPTLTVKAGATVKWVAQGFHSANSGTPPTVDPSGPIQADIGFQTYSVKFAKPGTYKYFCQPHAGLGMVGEIVVT